MADPTGIPVLANNAAPAAIVDAIERHGAAIVERFWPADVIASINADLDETVNRWPAGSTFADEIMQAAHGPQTKRFSSLVRRSQSFLELMLDGRVGAVVDHFLLPHAGSYLLNTGQLMEIGPGAPQQVPHRDDWNWPGSHRDLCYSVHTITSLTDFTASNGATLVAPGSHAWEESSRYPSPEEMIPCEMPVGSVLVYTGQLIHGAGANVTATERRRAIEMSFVLGWLRAEENHLLSLDVAEVCTLPERAQELLGYRAYEHRAPAGRLGLVDYADPVHALRERGLLGTEASEGTAWPLRDFGPRSDGRTVGFGEPSDQENIGWLRGQDRYARDG